MVKIVNKRGAAGSNLKMTRNAPPITSPDESAIDPMESLASNQYLTFNNKEQNNFLESFGNPKKEGFVIAQL